jgi:hypothetical protein
MLTTMTEDDWTIVLKLFGASRSHRGDKGRDDRKFLEALHRGGLFRKGSGIGPASGNGSGD